MILHWKMTYISEPAVSLHHNEMRLMNNSVLLASSVRVNEAAIVCRTARRPCCKTTKKYGEWYYPDNTSVVPNMDTGWSFYRDRRDNGTVNLHRVHENNITGKFCCQVPDKNCNGLNHTLCIELGNFYNRLIIIILMVIFLILVSLGSIVSSGESIAGEEYNLTCLASATGSSMVTFQWFRQDEQSISSNNKINIITRMFESVLQFNPLQQSHSGTYKCRVTLGSTSRNGTKTISVRGK